MTPRAISTQIICSTSSTLRRKLHHCASLRLQDAGAHRSSTKASTSACKEEPSNMLPDEKMDHLVKLYHGAHSFITLENLTQRIDEAFVPATRLMATAQHLGTNVDESRYQVLLDDVQKQRDAPRFLTRWDDLDLDTNPRNPDLSKIGRPRPTRRNTTRAKSVQEMVHSTLYGTYGGTRPGWDIVKERREQAKEEREREKTY